ncbi:MAG: hypothetical protein ACI30N_03940 [Muribaculaceae bacterium]
MSDWTFHYDESQYARTAEGYLRARITTKEPGTGTDKKYHSKFFVIDYLPQKVSLSYDYVDTPATRAVTSSEIVRIYFSNTEGVDRIVMEKLREGSRIPSKISITDLKPGYFDVTINKATTFTAVGYNENGTSRGVPITISPQAAVSSLDFELKDNSIYIESDEALDSEYSYSISSLDVSAPQVRQQGTTTGVIDISTLSGGLYVVTVTDGNGVSDTFKFKK